MEDIDRLIYYVIYRIYYIKYIYNVICFSQIEIATQ